jgi:hypothetical protein
MGCGARGGWIVGEHDMSLSLANLRLGLAARRGGGGGGGGSIPINALRAADGNPILTADGHYILLEAA